MTCAVALALSVALCAAPPAFPSPEADVARAAHPLLRFSGNLVMPEEVYRTALELAGTPVDVSAESALQVETTLTRFLRRGGYELASVSVSVDGDHLAVAINEGQLEKVVFRGRLTVQTLSFKLALSIPSEVFNRPALDRQMQRLAGALQVEKVWYELVRTAQVAHLGPQLEELPAIQGVQLIHARRPYELHVFFAEKAWDLGAGLDLRSGWLNGLEAGANYQGSGGILRGDRWRVAGSAGAGLRQRIADGHYLATFTRTYAEARWHSPGLPYNFRPFVWLEGDVLARQRRDLNLENYFATVASGSVHLAQEPGRGLRLSLGGGYEYRRLLELRAAPEREVPPTAAPSERLRPFTLLHGDVVLDPGAGRSDRRHALSLDVRQHFGARQAWFGYAAHRYSVVVPVGWHDFWLRSRSKILWGESEFHDEEPVGEYLHGLFGDQWARRIGNLSTELRFSLARDVFKVSLFHDVAVFGLLDRVTNAQRPLLANSFGPGLHTLVEGMFQLDVYLAFGFRSDGRIDTAVSAILQKVF